MKTTTTKKRIAPGPDKAAYAEAAPGHGNKLPIDANTSGLHTSSAPGSHVSWGEAEAL